ncbi:MAG: hypothetical protein WC890_01725 [Candidatus Margulisiibacteriota bacterium]
MVTEDILSSARYQRALSNRRLIRIRPQVASMLSRFAPLQREDPILEDVVVQFCRGRQALFGNQSTLNVQGSIMLASANELLFSRRLPSVEQILEMLPTLPTVNDPQLHLFKPPFSLEETKSLRFRRFKELFNIGGGTGIIQIGSGCWNNCEKCYALAIGKRVVFMPLPMALLLAEQLIDVNDGLFQPYFSNDILQWRDLNFSADYGDLLALIHARKIKTLGSITGGFFLFDPFGIEAARKLVEAKEVRILSVDFIKRKIFPFPESKPNQAAIEAYGKRVSANIQVLKPEQIRLYHAGKSPSRLFHEYYMLDLFCRYVTPEKHIGFIKERVDPVEISYEGRATSSPYFHGLSFYPVASGARYLQVLPSGENKLIYRRGVKIGSEMKKAKTVSEVFSSPSSPAFLSFVRKIRYYLNDSQEKCRTNIAIWEMYFSMDELVQIFGQDGEDLAAIYEKLKDLPVFEAEFLSSICVGDLATFSQKKEYGLAKRMADQPKLSHSCFVHYLHVCLTQQTEEVIKYVLPLQGERSFLMSFEDGKLALRAAASLSGNIVTLEDAQNISEDKLQQIFSLLKDLPLSAANFWVDFCELPNQCCEVTLPLRAYAGEL